MPNPVYLDGPLKGQDLPVTQDIVDKGQIITRAEPGGPQIVYTITRVQVFDRVLVVASAAGAMPALDILFENLVSERAKAAAE